MHSYVSIINLVFIKVLDFDFHMSIEISTDFIGLFPFDFYMNTKYTNPASFIMQDWYKIFNYFIIFCSIIKSLNLLPTFA